MTNRRISAFLVATFIVIAAGNISVDAQTSQTNKGDSPSVTDKSARISLSIALPIEHIPMGQKPWVSLTVKNSGSQEINYPRESSLCRGTQG